MVDQIIRPADLPNRASPNASEKIPVDNGSSVAGATVESIVLAGRPTASQAEAEAGTDAVKTMTPLTSRQGLVSQIGVTIASKAQGDKADTAVQPSDLSAVATSNDYDDLDNRPTLGTAAAEDAGAFATAEQGDKADSAIQSISEGVNVEIDNSDPRNPIISVPSTFPDNSVTEPKMADTLTITLPTVVDSKVALSAVDLSRYNTAFLNSARIGGMFVWEGADHAANGNVSRPVGTTTAVDTGTETCTIVDHKLLTGQAVCVNSDVNGLIAGTIYFVNRVSDDTLRLSSTFDGAFAGTSLVNLTGNTNFALRRLMDPLQAIYVIPSGGSIDGSNGAWVRGEYLDTYEPWAHWFGAVGDAVANDTAPIFFMLDFTEKQFRSSRFGGRCHLSKGTFNFTRQLRIGNMTTVKGAGQYVSTLAPSSSLTSGHTIILGPDNTVDKDGASVFGFFGSYVFGTILEDLDIKGGNIYRGNDTALVYTEGAHQPSGIYRCAIREVVSFGVFYDKGNGGPANFVIANTDVEAGTTNPTVGSKIGIMLNGAGAIIDLDTVNVQGGTSTFAVAIDARKDNVSARAIHIENATVGYRVAQNESQPRINVIDGITGHSTVPTLVQRPITGNGQLVVNGALNQSLATTGLKIIDDARTGYVELDGVVTHYDSEDPMLRSSVVTTDVGLNWSPLTHGGNVRHTGALTANRTINLSTTGAIANKTRLWVTRTGAGAFNLSVGGLKNLTQNTWCEVVYNGSAYYLAAYGAL